MVVSIIGSLAVPGSNIPPEEDYGNWWYGVTSAGASIGAGLSGLGEAINTKIGRPEAAQSLKEQRDYFNELAAGEVAKMTPRARAVYEGPIAWDGDLGEALFLKGTSLVPSAAVMTAATALTAGVGAGVVGGMLAGTAINVGLNMGDAVNTAYQGLDEVSDEELLKNPAIFSAYNSGGKTMQEIRADIGAELALIAATPTGVVSAITGPISAETGLGLWASRVFKPTVAGGLIKSKVAGIAGGAAFEGGSEALEEGSQAYGINTAAERMGLPLPKQDVGRTMLEAGVLGALPGAAVGGLVTGRTKPAPAPAPADGVTRVDPSALPPDMAAATAAAAGRTTAVPPAFPRPAPPTALEGAPPEAVRSFLAPFGYAPEDLPTLPSEIREELSRRFEAGAAAGPLPLEAGGELERAPPQEQSDFLAPFGYTVDDLPTLRRENPEIVDELNRRYIERRPDRRGVIPGMTSEVEGFTGLPEAPVEEAIPVEQQPGTIPYIFSQSGPEAEFPTRQSEQLAGEVRGREAEAADAAEQRRIEYELSQLTEEERAQRDQDVAIPLKPTKRGEEHDEKRRRDESAAETIWRASKPPNWKNIDEVKQYLADILSKAATARIKIPDRNRDTTSDHMQWLRNVRLTLKAMDEEPNSKAELILAADESMARVDDWRLMRAKHRRKQTEIKSGRELHDYIATVLGGEQQGEIGATAEDVEPGAAGLGEDVGRPTRGVEETERAPARGPESQQQLLPFPERPPTYEGRTIEEPTAQEEEQAQEALRIAEGRAKYPEGSTWRTYVEPKREQPSAAGEAAETVEQREIPKEEAIGVVHEGKPSVIKGLRTKARKKAGARVEALMAKFKEKVTKRRMNEVEQDIAGRLHSIEGRLEPELSDFRDQMRLARRQIMEAREEADKGNADEAQRIFNNAKLTLEKNPLPRYPYAGKTGATGRQSYIGLKKTYPGATDQPITKIKGAIARTAMANKAKPLRKQASVLAAAIRINLKKAGPRKADELQQALKEVDNAVDLLKGVPLLADARTALARARDMFEAAQRPELERKQIKRFHRKDTGPVLVVERKKEPAKEAPSAPPAPPVPAKYAAYEEEPEGPKRRRRRTRGGYFAAKPARAPAPAGPHKPKLAVVSVAEGIARLKARAQRGAPTHLPTVADIAERIRRGRLGRTPTGPWQRGLAALITARPAAKAFPPVGLMPDPTTVGRVSSKGVPSIAFHQYSTGLFHDVDMALAAVDMGEAEVTGNLIRGMKGVVDGLFMNGDNGTSIRQLQTSINTALNARSAEQQSELLATVADALEEINPHEPYFQTQSVYWAKKYGPPDMTGRRAPTLRERAKVETLLNFVETPEQMPLVVGANLTDLRSSLAEAIAFSWVGKLTSMNNLLTALDEALTTMINRSDAKEFRTLQLADVRNLLDRAKKSSDPSGQHRTDLMVQAQEKLARLRGEPSKVQMAIKAADKRAQQKGKAPSKKGKPAAVEAPAAETTETEEGMTAEEALASMATPAETAEETPAAAEAAPETDERIARFLERQKKVKSELETEIAEVTSRVEALTTELASKPFAIPAAQGPASSIIRPTVIAQSDVIPGITSADALVTGELSETELLKRIYNWNDTTIGKLTPEQRAHFVDRANKIIRGVRDEADPDVAGRKENRKAAAVRYRGEVFSAPEHNEALALVADKVGGLAAIDESQLTVGYINDQGKYVPYEDQTIANIPRLKRGARDESEDIEDEEQARLAEERGEAYTKPPKGAIRLMRGTWAVPLRSTTLSAAIDEVDVNTRGISGRVLSQIYATLKRTVGAVPVHIVSEGDMVKMYGAGANAAYSYDHNGDPIIVVRSGIWNSDQRPRVVGHEGIHAVAMTAISFNPELKARLEGLLAHVKGKLPGRKMRGLVDVDEMLSELANPAFADELRNITIPRKMAEDFGLPAWRKATAWQAVMKFIANVFGINDYTAFEAALSSFERISHRLDPEAKRDFASQMSYEGIAPDEVSMLMDEFGQYDQDITRAERWRKGLDRTPVRLDVDEAVEPSMAATVFKAGLRSNIFTKGPWHRGVLKWRTNDNIMRASEPFYGRDAREYHNLSMRRFTRAQEMNAEDVDIQLERQRLYDEYKDVKVDGQTAADFYSDLKEDATNWNINPAIPMKENTWLGEKSSIAKLHYDPIRASYEKLLEKAPKLAKYLNKEFDYFGKKGNHIIDVALRNNVLDAAKVTGHEISNERAVAIAERIMKSDEDGDTEATAEDYKIVGEKVIDRMRVVPEFKKRPGVFAPALRYGDHIVSAIVKVIAPTWEHVKFQKEGADGMVYDFYGPDEEAAEEAATQWAAYDHRGKLREEYSPPIRKIITNADGERRNPETGKKYKKSDPGTQVRFRATVQNRQVGFFENQRDAEDAVAKLSEDGHYSEVKDWTWKIGEPPPQVASSSFHQMQSVMTALETRDVFEKLPPDVAAANRSALQEALLRMAPGTSISKRRMYKRHVAGASKDDARVMHSYSIQVNNYIAAMEMAPALDRAEKKLFDKARADRSSKGTAIELFNELRSRRWAQNGLHDNSSPWINTLTGIVFVDKLVSIAYSVVNQIQPHTNSLPKLAGDFNWVDASSAMHQAMSDVHYGTVLKKGIKDTWEAMRGRLEKSENLIEYVVSSGKVAADEIEMLRELVKRSSLNSDAGFEAGHVLKRGPATSLLAYTERFGRELPRAIDNGTRAYVALAAYRLSKNAGKSVEAATDYAQDIVDETLFNYSPVNSPPKYNQGFWRIPLQFTRFGLATYQFLAAHALRAIKPGPQRAAAMKTLGYTFAVYALFSGLGGALPLEPLRVVVDGLNAAGLIDFDWSSIEATVREAAAQMIGPTLAEALMRGLPRLLDIDLSTRVSLTQLLAGQPHGDIQDPKNLGDYILSTLTGPTGGIIKDFFTTSQALAKGNLVEAAENGIPVKFIGDMIKGARIGIVGEKSKAGDIINTYNIPEILIQAMGFTPGSRAETMEFRETVFSAQTRKEKSRNEILQGFWELSKAERSRPSNLQYYRDQFKKYNMGLPRENWITFDVARDYAKNKDRRFSKSVRGVTSNRATRPLIERYSQVYQ